MTIAEFVQFLTGAAAVIAASASFIAAVKIERVHKATNSMKDELVRVTRSDAFEQGRMQERADQADRDEK